MRTLIKPVNARKELKNFGALAGYASLSFAAVLLASGARAQDSGAAPEPAVPAEQTAAAFADPEWSVPRLSWGDPDLQGTFTSRDMSGIPMERPQQFGTRRQLNAEEFAERLAGGEGGLAALAASQRNDRAGSSSPRSIRPKPARARSATPLTSSIPTTVGCRR